MTMKLKHLTALACGLAPVLLPTASQAQAAPKSDDQKVEQRIDDLKAMKKEMQRMMRTYEARIEKLEAEVKARPPAPVKVAADKPQAMPGASPEQQLIVISEETDGSAQIAKTKPRKAQDEWDFGSWGTYTSGKGFVLTRGVDGDLNMSLIAYARYLNQTGLDPSYTDSFGRTTQLHLRQDCIWN